MAVVTTNLGVITAYGDAVAAGYTGTKAEWQALMANYATVGQQAAQDAQTASQAAQTATTKAGEASQSATRAENAAASITTPDATLTQAGVAADAKATGDEIGELKEGFNDLYNTAYVTDSASGGVAHFVDGADDVPLKSLKVNIEPVQSGSGDPSPENDRPIGGWDAVKATRAGKNLLPNYASASITRNGITLTNVDGVYTLSGTATGAANFDIPLPTPITQGTEIHIALKNEAINSGVVCYTQAIGPSNINGIACSVVDNGGVFMLSKEMIQFRLRINSGTSVDNFILSPMITVGTETPTEFEPYNGNTYGISLASAGTVYGGTLDVLSGVLTVTHNITNLSGSENGWFKSAITNVDVYCLPLSNNSLDGDSVLSHFNYVNQRNYNVEGCAWYDSDGKQLRIGYATSGTDLTAFKTWLASNNVQLFSRLDNPLTYNLTPTEIKSLLGINNVWSDAGDVEVEYRADTKLYIKRLTDSDTDMIADSNIVSGQYFMVGNDLYKATVNIASGAQIVVGTNAAKVSLSEALNEINA